MQRAIASFGSLKTLIFACKTNSSTLKNTTILRAKNQKIFWGGGTAPFQTPPPVGRGTPPPTPLPLGVYGASIFAPAALKLGAIGHTSYTPMLCSLLAPP